VGVVITGRPRVRMLTISKRLQESVRSLASSSLARRSHFELPRRSRWLLRRSTLFASTMSIRRGGLDVDGRLQAWSKHRLVTVAPSGLGFRHSIVKGKTTSRDAVQLITLIHFHNWRSIREKQDRLSQSTPIMRHRHRHWRGHWRPTFCAPRGQTKSSEGGGRIKTRKGEPSQSKLPVSRKPYPSPIKSPHLNGRPLESSLLQRRAHAWRADEPSGYIPSHPSYKWLWAERP
jgi:hypothetical protein